MSKVRVLARWEIREEGDALILHGFDRYRKELVTKNVLFQSCYIHQSSQRRHYAIVTKDGAFYVLMHPGRGWITPAGETDFTDAPASSLLRVAN